MIYTIALAWYTGNINVWKYFISRFNTEPPVSKSCIVSNTKLSTVFLYKTSRMAGISTSGSSNGIFNARGNPAYSCGAPLIIIDFGTATTFNVLDEKGEFIGGVIAPGIKGSLDSLVNGTAKLPRVEIERPASVIAKNTVTNMQAGIVFGFAGLVGYIVKKIKKELKAPDVKTVATGGFSEVIAKEIDCIDCVDKFLTLDGLKYLYYLNSAEG